LINDIIGEIFAHSNFCFSEASQSLISPQPPWAKKVQHLIQGDPHIAEGQRGAEEEATGVLHGDQGVTGDMEETTQSEAEILMVDLRVRSMKLMRLLEV